MRRDGPDALVNHVNDRTLRILRQMLGEPLDEHKGRTQVWLDMRIPRDTRDVVPLIAFEPAGIVDQHADRAKVCGRFSQDALNLRFLGKIGRDHRRATPAAANIVARCNGFLLTPMTVDRYIKPGIGERKRDGAANPPCASGNDGSAGDRGRNRSKEGRHYLFRTALNDDLTYRNGAGGAKPPLAMPGPQGDLGDAHSLDAHDQRQSRS